MWGTKNKVIFTTGRSTTRGFSVLVSNFIPEIKCQYNGQGFMEYNNRSKIGELIKNTSNINDVFLDKYGLSRKNVFAYIYGLLNSKEYCQKYKNDLNKDLARIPLVKEKQKYVEIGQKLMDLHLNYEKVPVYNNVDIQYSSNSNYQVKKMKHPNKRNAEGKLEKDYSTIIFNDSITISNIPEKAYEYVVNGKPAIEWIMDQYQVKTDKKSGITDDPNDYSDDPKYIFNLLLRIINVSVQTVDLINQLPPLAIIDDH